MKNKVPKRHTQLGLPVGSRVRFALGKQKENFYLGTIIDGIPLPEGWYWIRKQHTFKGFKLKAKAIRGIEYIPGTPECPRPLPPCPKPRPRNGRQLPAIVRKITLHFAFGELKRALLGGYFDSELQTLTETIQERYSKLQ